MKTGLVRSTLVAIVMLGLLIPGVASADWFNWGCRYQGTWFGVKAQDNMELAGWMATVEGKSYFYGTNNLEFTVDTFDARLPVPGTEASEEPVYQFPTVVGTTTNRGNWMRTGYNTFAYTTTGFALDADGKIVYVAKLSGHITLSEDCNHDVVTGMLEIYLPGTMKNPFIDGLDEPDFGPYPIDDVYGYRARVNLP